MKLAVVGAGAWGQVHAAKLASRDDVELSAVVDRNLSKARSLAQDLGGCQAFQNIEELDASVDAVVVAVDIGELYRASLQALTRRLHVLVEKPMATSPREALILERVAADQDRVLAVGYLERFNPNLDALRDIKDGIVAYRMGTGLPRCGPLLYDWTVHDLDLAGYLLGGDLHLSRFRRFRQGVSLQLSSSNGGKARIVTFEKARRAQRGIRSAYGQFVLGSDGVDLLGRELSAFLGLIRGGSRGRLASASDAYKVLRLLGDGEGRICAA